MADSKLEERLRQLFIEISQDMTTDDLIIIKFKVEIPAGEAESLNKPIHLWSYLEKQDYISVHDEEKTLEYLQRILDPRNFRGQVRLINHVKRYRGEAVEDRAATDRPQIDPSMAKAFDYLSCNLGGDWRRFFRKLGMDYTFCDKLMETYSHEKLSEIIYIGLCQWLEYKPRKTIGDILNALIQCDLNWHKDEIKLMLQEYNVGREVDS